MDLVEEYRHLIKMMIMIQKHNEIFYDTNNYVELLIEIDDEKYELTRYIGDNLIFVVGEDEEISETCVLRNQSDEHTMVFF